MQLIQAENAETVVVKCGAAGAFVYIQTGQATQIPSYRSARVFKIGSGDVFSAAFAHFWGEQGIEPAAAADLASRCTAWYCDRRQLPLPSPQELETLSALSRNVQPGRIYLAAPFFDIGQRWAVEEARLCLVRLGADVFSPVHEVGFDVPEVVAPADLAGLQTCSAVLAIVSGGDPGTLFEIGYARRLGIPVIALAERTQTRDLTMLIGSGCEIARDFASAVYRAIWASH